MKITSSSNEITITGNIKTMKDFQDIKSFIDGIVKEHKSMVINVTDSLSITSSVIGYFNRLVQKNGISITMNVGSDQLLNLIDDLNLTSIFKAKKA